MHKKKTPTMDTAKVVQITVPRRAVPYLIGEGGHAIKEIEGNTATKIQISKKREETENPTVTITGTPEGTQQAKETIQNRVWAWKSSQQTQPLHISLQVPSAAVGVLIGKGGKNKKYVEARTETHIRFYEPGKKDTSPTGDLCAPGIQFTSPEQSTLIISGPSEAKMNEAKKMLLAELEKWKEHEKRSFSDWNPKEEQPCFKGVDCRKMGCPFKHPPHGPPKSQLNSSRNEKRRNKNKPDRDFHAY